jgi:hypothetical protein
LVLDVQDAMMVSPSEVKDETKFIGYVSPNDKALHARRTEPSKAQL